MKRLENRVNIVTGGSLGIGREGCALASDESKFMTGSELVIDGGYTCK